MQFFSDVVCCCWDQQYMLWMCRFMCVSIFMIFCNGGAFGGNGNYDLGLTSSFAIGQMQKCVYHGAKMPPSRAHGTRKQKKVNHVHCICRTINKYFVVRFWCAGHVHFGAPPARARDCVAFLLRVFVLFVTILLLFKFRVTTTFV